MAQFNPNKANNELPDLPPKNFNLDDVRILKKAGEAHRYLAELKGYCYKLPNPELLMNTIVLQESKDSSAIENIVTTNDDLYRAILNPSERLPSQTKEVISYRAAMYAGLEELKRSGAVTSRLAIRIAQTIKKTTAEYRAVPGTKLLNPVTGKITYTPPDPHYIIHRITAWERFINQQGDVDPLVLMALMHYQFEAIHPFADGNGRTGRILNVLFLVKNNLLTLPVLYHSRYIIQHKTAYYRTLRLVTEKEEWMEWILFMLGAVMETSISTLELIRNIVQLKDEILQKIKRIKQKLPVMELNELIFSYPYIKIQILVDQQIAQRLTASRYLQALTEAGILKRLKSGKEVYYINHRLMSLLTSRE